MNIGTIVPPTVAPLLAGLLITSRGTGYSDLFGLAALIALIGSFFVYRIHTVR